MRKYISLRCTPPETNLTGGDTDEMDGTLNDLRAWVDSMIATHGGEAEISIEAESDARPYYTITRLATADEIEEESARKAAAEEKRKAERRAEFEKMKAEFETK